MKFYITELERKLELAKASSDYWRGKYILQVEITEDTAWVWYKAITALFK